MNSSYSQNLANVHASASAATYAALGTGRDFNDFTTIDGRLVPRALGEAALRQRTALLIGGLLVGHWPEQL